MKPKKPNKTTRASKAIKETKATNLNFAHLDEAARTIVEHADVDRYTRIYQDMFVEHREVAAILRYMTFLFHMPRKVRMPGLVITSDSGMGKTHLLRRLQRQHPPSIGHRGRVERLPVLYCQIPPGPTLMSVQQAMLSALDAPPVEMTRASARNVLITKLLEEAGTQLICIDEAQHFLSVPRRELSHLYDWVKFISTESRLPVVMAGIRGCEIPIKSEPQLSTRFRIKELRRWTAGPGLAEFLHAYERSCPLRLPSRLASKEMMRAILRESGGVTDLIVQCLQYAACIAIKSGQECITEGLLPMWQDPDFIPTMSSLKRAAGEG